MNCPVCKDARLVMTERQGIEIDYCPACRGIWLDRGELDKIIERSISHDASGQPPRGDQAHQDSGHWGKHGHHHDDHGHHDHGRAYPRRKSFWQQLFD